MRELTIAEIATVNGAGSSTRPASRGYWCYVPVASNRGSANVGALAGAAVAGGAVALGVAAAVKLKLFALALC
jgi:hypothetical protein